MASPLTANNRINVPSVCRVRSPTTNATYGTAVLVGPALLLTSASVIEGHTHDIVATFFEGTKKRAVDVKLLPEQYSFTASYPDHMDYCLIACEQGPILNVVPVHIPLIRKEWVAVVEGDILLVIQHPITAAAGTAGLDHEDSHTPATLDLGGALEQKRFAEIIRCRNDLFFLKSEGSGSTAGCPAFNEAGELVGLQCQMRTDGEGITNRVLSVVSIVKHLFVNGQLSHLPQQGTTFDEVWSTWFTQKDVSRIISILENFKGKDMVRQVTRHLCDLTATPALVKSITQCGGIGVILANMVLFPGDDELSGTCLRALWNVSVGDDDSLAEVVRHGGVNTILAVMEAFQENELILQFGTVLLHNISTCPHSPDFASDLGARTLRIVHASVMRFTEPTVLQKFGLSVFTTLIKQNEQFAVQLMKLHIMDHIIYLIETQHTKEFLMEVLMQFVGEIAEYRSAVAVCSEEANLLNNSTARIINLLMDIMLEYREHDAILAQGNRALWGFGNDPQFRAVILQNPNSSQVFHISINSLMALTKV